MPKKSDQGLSILMANIGISGSLWIKEKYLCMQYPQKTN